MKEQLSILSLVIFVLLAGVASANTFGQSDWGDSGTFRVSIGERVVGTEESSLQS